MKCKQKTRDYAYVCVIFRISNIVKNNTRNDFKI